MVGKVMDCIVSNCTGCSCKIWWQDNGCPTQIAALERRCRELEAERDAAIKEVVGANRKLGLLEAENAALKKRLEHSWIASGDDLGSFDIALEQITKKNL